MKKTATVEHDVHELIRERWSPRAFDPRPMERAKLLSLLEAARWAPSCYNEQPWRFILAEKNDTPSFERLLACLLEGNQIWARHAAVLLLTVAKLEFDHNGQPNRHAFHDVGMASENLTLQATALGLAAHFMGGYHVEKARELLGIPTGYEPVAAAALGYPGDPSILPDRLREREQASRQRVPLTELIFAGTWGTHPSW
jgi:nitroreductase